jgi:hypothetical protein
MRTAFLIGLCLLVGCSEDPTAWQQAMRETSEEVVAKQDESIVILKSNTTALAAIKSQVESLSAETREATDTLKASLVKTEAVNAKEVIKSAEPQEVAKANQSQPSKPVASPPAVRSSGPLKLSWNIEGNWQPSILETAKHLREDHGVNVNDLNHQQLHDLHAALHEGRKVANKSQPVQMISRGSQCPDGRCPTVRRGLFGRRR